MIRDDSAFQAQDLITATANAMAAAAAQATASADPAFQPAQELQLQLQLQQQHQEQQQQQQEQHQSDPLKRDLNSEKVRTENRERKKRWREQNEDRNKDNDLRCRVNKRANKLFGKQDSEHKARWIEEEFGKRQVKRKEKERRRNPNSSGSVEPTPPPQKSSVSLNEHLALHQQAQAAQQAADQLPSHAGQDHLQQQQQQHQQHVQISSHHALSHAQFDHTTVKTALALNDLVKKNGSHLDLAQLTGVLTDPNLARQLIEIEARNPVQPPPTAAMMLMHAPVKSEHDITNSNNKASSMLEADYPMDAVLTLMQLNGSWKA